MAKRITETESSVIVYDDSRVSHISAEMFAPAYWKEAQQANVQQGGRGAVLFVNHAGSDWVIRHYFRGGLVGKVLTDQYLWTGQKRTRPFAEWRLLAAMQDLQLPAPVPVAARYERAGLWYRADLITENLGAPGTLKSFAGLFAVADTELWEAVGTCIAVFHQHGFCHADLNAWNIQLGANGRIYILDWDRGRRLPPGKWRVANLKRLRRSLKKLSEADGKTVDAADWQALLNAYNARTR